MHVIVNALALSTKTRQSVASSLFSLLRQPQSVSRTRDVLLLHELDLVFCAVN
jgi:hypothetical protein